MLTAVNYKLYFTNHELYLVLSPSPSPTDRGIRFKSGSMSGKLKTWATQKLKVGDLSALASMANGRKDSEPQRVRRLASRGFIAESGDGNISVTARGRIALMIKRVTAFF